jgi:hypothetical protein
MERTMTRTADELRAPDPALLARIEVLEEMARWIAVNYENQDMSHVDFRVGAKMLADTALGHD